MKRPQELAVFRKQRGDIFRERFVEKNGWKSYRVYSMF
jgi:hypothetical protein